jgi:hypothetical protein
MTKQYGEDKCKHCYLGSAYVKFLNRVASFTSASMASSWQTYETRYPTKYNRLQCLMEVENLLQNLQNNWMVWCTPLETLQGTYRVCAKKETLPRLLLNEWKGSLDGVKCGHVHVITAVEAVFENLVFIHEGTSSSSLNK